MKRIKACLKIFSSLFAWISVKFFASNQESLISLDNATFSNGSDFAGSTSLGADSLKSFDNIDTLDNLTEDDVAAIEPGGLNEGDKELGAVCVGTSVGHRKKVGAGVLKVEVLVREFLSINGFSTGTVAIGEVATLSHELWDNSVEVAAHVVKEFASVVLIEAFSYTRKVLDGLGNGVTKHTKDNTTSWYTIKLDIEVNFLSDSVKSICECDRHEGGKESQYFHYLVYNLI